MTFTWIGLLLFLGIAAICGAIGRAIAGGSRGGLFVSMALGFVGALLGSWISQQMHLPELFAVSIDGHSFPVVGSIIGSALFVAFLHLISRRP